MNGRRSCEAGQPTVKRSELEHLIRAAGAITHERDFIIIGSQSILGPHPHAPDDLLLSMEADMYPRDAPGKAEEIEGAIGELSAFHETFAYYAQGVGPETAVLPEGWQERLVPIQTPATEGRTGWCLDPDDLAVSKLVAFREKDREFVGHMLTHGLADAAQVRERFVSLTVPDAVREAALGWLRKFAS